MLFALHKNYIILHTNGMITLLLVCIFFGVNVRVYFDMDKMQCVASVILPLNINIVNFRISLASKRLFYKINNGKDRQIVLKQSKSKKQFKPCQIRIENLNWTMSIGCNENCLNGVYLSGILGYLLDMATNFVNKYVTFSTFDKVILPNFQKNESMIMLNIVIKKGILDIIKSLVLTNLKRGKYANW